MKFRIAPLVAATMLTGGLVAAPLTLTPRPASAAQPATDIVTALQGGLVNINVQDVNVERVVVVNVKDVLNNSLNNNNVEVLKNFLNNNKVASDNSNFLNNLLRNAKILNNNQIVVGVLSGPIPVIFVAQDTGKGKK